MARITNEILAVKIEALHEDLCNIKGDVKQNNEFRIQSKGFITAVVMISSTLGAGIVSLINYLIGKGG